MPRSKKIWLGVLTFLPILFFIGYFASFFLFIFGIQEFPNSPSEPIDPTTFLSGFGLMFLSMFLAIISGIGIMIYFIIHAVNNKNFTETDRLLWILILVLASGMGSIVYYFVIIIPLKSIQINKIE